MGRISEDNYANVGPTYNPNTSDLFVLETTNGTRTISSDKVVNPYSKTELDASFKNPYSKTELDASFKNPYSKNELDASFKNPYSKTELDAFFADKQDSNGAFKYVVDDENHTGIDNPEFDTIYLSKLSSGAYDYAKVFAVKVPGAQMIWEYAFYAYSGKIKQRTRTNGVWGSWLPIGISDNIDNGAIITDHIHNGAVTLPKLGSDLADSIDIGYIVSENKTEYLSNKSDVKWDDGSISSSSGGNKDSATRCRTVGYVAFDDTVAIQISVKAGYKVAIAAYNGSNSSSYVGFIRDLSNEQAVYKITNKRYRFVVAYDDDSEIAHENIPTDCITVVCYARSKDIAKKEIAMATCFEQLIADTQNESLTWEQGNVSTYDGLNQRSVTNRCHTEFILAKRGKLSVTVGDGYMFRVLFYTSPAASDYTHNYTDWFADDYQQAITENCYIKLVIRKQDNSDITPADIASDALALSQSIYQDDTLTAENLPAQAKAVSDAISVAKNYEIYDSMMENYDWVQGGISSSGGGNTTSSNRCRSKYFFFGDSTLRVIPKEGYLFNIFRYNRTPINDPMWTGNFRDSLGGLSDKEVFLRTDYCYIRFVIAKADGSDISPDTVPFDCMDVGIAKSPTNLPAEYSTHLFDKIQSVNNNVGVVGKNGETFIFITDLHWDSGNMKKSPMMVKRILDKTPVNTIVCGGDLINNGTNKDVEKRRINDCIKQFYDPRAAFPVAFGNHDANSNNQAGYPERHFSRNEVFALMMKQVSNNVIYLNDVDWSFTYDRPGTKTRFLFIDTGRYGTINPSARQSIYDALNDVPTDYHLIVVAHWLYSITDSDFTPYGSELVSVLEAYNARSSITLVGNTYDYSNANGKCECIMIGHSHDDAQGVTANGIPWILTDSDNIQRSHNFTDEHYRHQNTTTEQCFDVVSIDYDTGDIHIVRFGAGADRDFSASTGTWTRSNDNIIPNES